jgi:DNA excision repair protein ERCC-1
MQYLHNVRWEYSESVLADYVMGGQACALYLRYRERPLGSFNTQSNVSDGGSGVCSIKYHLLHPEYIITRMRQLGSRFNLSIVLCLVDVEGNTQPLEVRTAPTLCAVCACGLTQWCGLDHRRS